jgi:hypothetical protein
LTVPSQPNWNQSTNQSRVNFNFYCRPNCRRLSFKSPKYKTEISFEPTEISFDLLFKIKF